MNETKTALQAEMLAGRLRKRLRHLQKWAKRLGTNAFRLYDRDIPEIPLVLDKYGDAVCGALYKRPYEKDDEEERQWIMAMRDAAAQALSLERSHIIIKQREKQRGKDQYEKIAGRGVTRIVSEGGLRFKVNLSDYLDTGLFLDRRAMRRMVAADSNGKRVLNLFCYTGSFSLAAAVGVPPYGVPPYGVPPYGGPPCGGAASTDSVDLSNTYLNWARENFSLNGFDAGAGNGEWGMGSGGMRHRLIRADAGAFLKRAAQAGQRWDSIIIDPPAFSNSKMAGDFDLNRDCAKLLAHCLHVLNPGGKLWFSASPRSFKAKAGELEAALKKDFPGAAVADIGDKIIDEDFKGKKVPKSFLIGSGV